MSATLSKLLDRRTLSLGVALFVLVALTAYVCVAFPRSQGRISPFWLANAWTLAALLRTRAYRWPALALAAFGGNLIANRLAGDSLAVAAGLSACNLVEVLLAAGIVRRLTGLRFDISRPSHLAALGGASLAGPLAASVIAAVFLGLIDHADILNGIAVWTQADALGLLTLTPSLMVLTQRARTPVDWRESWTLVVLAVVTVGIFFLAHRPILFVISAVLTLPTWRMGLPGAVAGFGIVGITGAAAMLTNHGPIMAQDDPVGRIVGLQAFLTVTFLTNVPVALARDAGERMKARLRTALAEARSARAEAEQAAAVKSEFLANMSHELRTPLTSVVGFTRLAAEQPELTPVTRGYIERVSEASKALLCAVNDILDFSKLEAGQVSFRREPVAVGALARATLELFTPQAAARDLSLSLDDATPPGLAVELDPDRLRQVLLNLVGNAVKFTREGGVTLRLGYDEAAARLMVSVIDTGPGIPAEHQSRLFKRFSQVDGSLNRGHGGTGLGLAICKGIVEAMGGEIGVESAPGHGSRFFLSVPAPRSQAEPQPAQPEALARTGLRVLVTDDHPANRELVRMFLSSIGAQITEAADGETAAACAAAQPFDVILMDLRMPGLDGFGALSRIRAAAGVNRATPILAFTADAERMSEDRLRAAGFEGAVAKPVDPAQLLAAISSALAEAGAHSELDLDLDVA